MTITITTDNILFSGTEYTKPSLGSIAVKLQSALRSHNGFAEYTCEYAEKVELFPERGFFDVTFKNGKKFMLIFVENDERFDGVTYAQLGKLMHISRQICDDEGLPREKLSQED